MGTEYDHRPGGSLKFKGADDDKKKKKKKKSSTSERVREQSPEASRDGRKDKQRERDYNERERSASKAAGDSDDEAGSSRPRENGRSALVQGSRDSGSASKDDSAYAHMTASERRYEEIRRQRLADKVRKEAKKSHKERVQDFNEKLEALTEHYDLPRIGPG